MVFAFTKGDKFPPMRRKERERVLMKAMRVPGIPHVVTSTSKRFGIDRLWEILDAIVLGKGAP